MAAGAYALLAYLLGGTCQSNAAVLIQYEFSQEECRRGVVADVAGGNRFFGDLSLDNSTASCLPGVGIERTSASPGSPGASSIGNTTLLREELLNDDSAPGHFSLELWLSVPEMPACDGFCTTPIVTIGEGDTSLDDDCQQNLGMMITYWTETGDFGARFMSIDDECERLWSGAIQPSESMGNALHLVLTIDSIVFFGEPYAYFRWYINGTRVARDLSKNVPPETMMTLWDSDFNLQLLDWSRQIPSSFYTEGPGIKIFYVAIHDETLGVTEILSRYSARITKSTPVVSDTTIGVAEDGEEGDHYEDPQSYLQVFPVSELQMVPLDVYDSDNDPATPNYDNSTSPRVFVNTLPLPGFLVNSSGDDISSVPFEVLGDAGAFAVRYRPILNDFSTNDSVVYANFSFYATDGESGTRSHTNATVSMYVFSKNDPPEAFNASHGVYAGSRQNIIPLNGTDMDAFDDVHGAAIVEAPARGTLFQVFNNGSVSNVAVTNDEPLWRPMVAYEHDSMWLRSNSPTDQTVGDDMFTFKVFDSHWNFSVPAVINITVLSGISAISQREIWWCFEDVNCEVELFGSTKSDDAGNMSITISGVPVYGNLFDAGINMPVEVGSTLSSPVKYPYDQGASVVYQPQMDFFTDPTTQWNGTQLPELDDVMVTFYASIELGGTRIFSPEVSQELRVRNVDDQSAIRCGDSILQTLATGVVDDDAILDDVRPDRLFIYNFSINEKDDGVDPVRVSVTAEYGYLTLNDTLRSRVSFMNTCSGTYNWRCRSDGVYSQNMVFVGAPEDVQHVLNGMLFVSYESNVVDNMTVTIHDGFEGDCIWQFATYSVRPTCHSSSCSITINVTETWLNDDRGPALISVTITEFFALFALISALGGLIVLKCLKSLKYCLCFCCRRRKRRRSKGAESKKMEVAASAPTPNYMSTVLNNAHRTPANIPAGRTTKEAPSRQVGAQARASRQVDTSPQARGCPPLGAGWLRRHQRGVGREITTAQGAPRGIKRSGELPWEDDG
ncbi:unnamed protein product [Ectocarpus sp. 4 AP-2014]